jgi:alkylation response protein AidB-like acyl-CoA dehydrogenase
LIGVVMPYLAPVKDMLFVMNELAGLSEVVAYPVYAQAGADVDLAPAILEESAKFNQDVVAHLNWPGDQKPSSFKDGVVTTTPGFKEAFEQFAAAGWQGVIHPVEFGGQGLPKLIATACFEMVHSASLSFALCPMLTDGAIEALLTAASPELQEQFVPSMISGNWTGSMCLTEPQAGSDLSMVRTRAVLEGNGTYQIFGSKIFITYGEHDMAKNIIHLVLARTLDAPEGVKGISLFVVPKFLVNADGSLGARNDVHCVSIEHKLGIKASPTAVLQFGDHGGAVAYLVGEENRGLEYMFVMMNAARFAVGMQGIALAERAYQKAVQYAKDRVQSRDLGGSAGPVAIIHQPDVKRMLMTMRASVEASRALAYYAAAAYDAQHASVDEEVRKSNQSLYEFLVPIVKGFSTEMSIEVASLGVQVHGGMGFIEETGAAQHYRDARILTIYEGTTAIQANDLVGRKTVRDSGATARVLSQRIVQTEKELAASGTPDAKAVLKQLIAGRTAFDEAVTYILAHAKTDTKAVYAGSFAYLRLSGLVLGAWQMARGLLAAERLRDSDQAFYKTKIATARFFAENLLPQAQALTTSIIEGGYSTNALEVEQF